MDTFVLGLVGLFLSALLLPISANLGVDVYYQYRNHQSRQRNELQRRRECARARAEYICGPNGENFPNPYA